MHRCLLVDEVSHRIAEACAPDYKNPVVYRSEPPHEKPQLRTLYALAQTCRALLDPALDVLWWYQIGVGDLVKCMPEDVQVWDIPRNKIASICLSKRVTSFIDNVIRNLSGN